VGARKRERGPGDGLGADLGVAVANACGYRGLHWASLGIVPLTCWAVTGDNWYEITASSDFIRRPGPLLGSVRRYVKVVTDERDACPPPPLRDARPTSSG